MSKSSTVYELDLDQDFENEYFDISDLGDQRSPTEMELRLLRSKVNALLYPEAEELLTSTNNPNELDVFEEIIQLESLTSEPEKPSDVFQGSQAHQKRSQEITSDDSLSQYFDEHTRIGFVRDQKNRKSEMESVMNTLMRKWKKFDINSDEYRMVRISDAIVNASKRLEEISLSNPVISAVKAKVDAVGQINASSTNLQSNYTQ